MTEQHPTGYPSDIKGPWVGSPLVYWAAPPMRAVIAGVGGSPLIRLSPVLAVGEGGYLRPASEAEAQRFDALLLTNADMIEDVVEDAVPSHRTAELLASLDKILADNITAKALSDSLPPPEPLTPEQAKALLSATINSGLDDLARMLGQESRRRGESYAELRQRLTRYAGTKGPLRA